MQFSWEQDDSRHLGSPEPKHRAGLRQSAWLIATIGLVCLGVALSVIWRKAQQGHQAARASVQAVVEAEADALRQGDEIVFLSMQDSSDCQWYRHRGFYWDVARRGCEFGVSMRETCCKTSGSTFGTIQLG